MKCLSLNINYLLFILFIAGPCSLLAQTPVITNGDGSPLTARYCYEDNNYPLKATPSGGTFSGCGIIQDNGQWFFNPVLASEESNVFPYQCAIHYTTADSLQTVSSTMMVWKPVVVNPPLQDSFTCDGSIRLSAYMQYAGAYDFQWTPAVFLEQSDTAIAKGNIHQTTTFVVTARDQVSGCTGNDTVTIEKYPLPTITVNNDTTILAGSAAPLQATGGNVYLWAPSYWLDNERIPNPVAWPQQPVTYTVKVTNEYGCSDSDSVHINIIEGVQLPNAFSPNGDGINDEFRLVNYGYEKIIHFVIYDRWGKQVFIADHNTKGWNGTINGKPAEVGTYYYNIRLQLMNGTEKLFRGSVILIR